MILTVSGLWSQGPNPFQTKTPSRSPSSLDGESILDRKSVLKLKNETWNKVITNQSFNQFNDDEYVRWLELYKDSQHHPEVLNPVSIEQKMALIEILNAELIQNESEKSNLAKMDKIKKHVAKFNKKSLAHSDALADFSSDFFIILKNPPKNLLSYFTANKSKKMNDALMKVLQEDMLLIGLKGILYRVPSKDNDQRLMKAEQLIKDLFQSGDWQQGLSEKNRDWLFGLNLPDEMLIGILVDGLNEHDQDLIFHLKERNMIDQYERFRKVFRSLSFLSGTYMYYESLPHKEALDFNLFCDILRAHTNN